VDELSEIRIGKYLVYEHIFWYCCVAFHAGNVAWNLEWLSIRHNIWIRWQWFGKASVLALGHMIAELCIRDQQGQ
jgi:hypothetical protein